MRTPLKTALLMSSWALLLIVPWLIYLANGWEIESDCDQIRRAPENFGYATAVAALLSLPFALGAAVQTRKWIRALCLAAALISLGAIAGGVLVSMVIRGSTVDCGGQPRPESNQGTTSPSSGT